MSKKLVYLAAFSAFTVAELLISLAILGVIAVFTIPKLLTINEDRRKAAIAKEVASMVAGAYQNYRLRATPLATTSGEDLLPFMNYVDANTTDPMIPSLRLHNGTYVAIYGGGASGATARSSAGFGGTSVKDYLLVAASVPSAGSFNQICFVLTFPGRITTLPTYIAENGSDSVLTYAIGSVGCPVVDPAFIQNWQ